ncbi:hypothetical protein [Nocardioides gansuensis]|nr:hypothetical protein [Nocardioides gansuensis]
MSLHDPAVNSRLVPGARPPDDAHPTSASWLLPTMVLGFFIASLARQAAKPISDFDTFWHIRLGDDILASRSVHAPTASWSALSDRPWVPTQWLTEVVVAGVHEVAGLPGVAFLFATALFALTWLIHRLCRGRAGATAAAMTTGLTVVAMSGSLSPRPHLATYLLLAVTLIGWLRTADDLRPRWWLVPLTWVWAMSHGMWFTGPLLGLVVIGGLVADRRVTRAQATPLMVVPLLSIVVAGLTPVGPALWGTPFAVAGVGSFITEWQAPSFRMVGPAAAMALVALVTLVWSRRQERASWVEIGVLLLGTAWILLAARTVALGGLLVAPLAASALQTLVGRPRDVPSRAERRVIAGWMLLCLAAVGLAVPSTAATPAAVPTALDADLHDLPDGSVVLNSYQLGGWLRWAHPDLEPVVDGMTEAYSVDHLSDYQRVYALMPGWHEIVEAYDASYALVEEQSPLAEALRDKRWTTLAEAEGYLLLQRAATPY